MDGSDRDDVDGKGLGHPPSTVPPPSVRAAILARVVQLSVGGGEAPLLDGRYRLLQEIGRGGAGTVWKAELLPLGRLVAVKLLRPAVGVNENAVSRLMREALTVSKLGHEHIVQVNDVGTDEHGSPYIAMELLEGESLAQLVSRHGRLPWSEVAEIATQICDALSAAHAVGVVHRDVSAKNILLSWNGDVKLTDFGVVRMRERIQQKTEPGLVKGKYAYLAPEYIAGEPCTVQSDIYATGVMLFELLSGRECFGGTTAYEVMWKIVNKGVPMYRLSREGVPEDLQRIVQKATAMVPERRYTSAQDMANSLEAWRMRSGRHATPWVLSVFFNRHELFPPPIKDTPILPAAATALAHVPTADLVSPPTPRLPAPQPLTASGRPANTPPPSEFELPILPVEPITQSASAIDPVAASQAPTALPQAEATLVVKKPVGWSAPSPIVQPTEDGKTPVARPTPTDTSAPARVASRPFSRPTPRELVRGTGTPAPPETSVPQKQSTPPDPIRVAAPPDLDVASARPMPTPVPTPLPTALEMAALTPHQQLPRGTPPSLRAAADVPPAVSSPVLAHPTPSRTVGPTTEDLETSAAQNAAPAEVVFGRGKLEDTAAAQVLARALEEESTGIIEFRCGLIWKRVIVVKGKPTGITSNMGMELIGEHLVKNRIISRADLDKALKASEQRQRPLTVMMLEHGALNQPTLEVELGRNLTARLKEVLEWRWGTFEYKPQDITAPDILPKMDLDALLAESGDLKRDESGKTELPSPDTDAPAAQQLSDALKVARSISKGGGKRVERPFRSK